MIIKKTIFKSIPLNLKLVKYGGEELDFAYRLHFNHYKKMIYCNSAIVTRRDHPALIKHLCRLEEFGRSNLALLEDSLQKRVLKKNPGAGSNRHPNMVFQKKLNGILFA